MDLQDIFYHAASAACATALLGLILWAIGLPFSFWIMAVIVSVYFIQREMKQHGGRLNFTQFNEWSQQVWYEALTPVATSIISAYLMASLF